MKLDNDLSYDLVRTHRKTLGLTVERDGNITLRAPLDCPQIVIDNFFKDKKMWVYKKLAEKKMVEEQLPSKKYVNGNGFFYLGKSYRLQLVDDGPPLKLSYGFFQLNKKYAANGKRIFIDWYRSHALPIIEGRVNIYKDMLGVNPDGIRILDLQYRWGSCSSNGSLNIHWKTILAPMPIVDYVVVHELVHLKEKNHTRKFWEIVASILPDYEKRKEWLKMNGNSFDL